jgi:LuxR family maltose regulon positive regulatory protein
LLRSWIRTTDLAARTAWITAERSERDPRRFWLSVTDALRATPEGSALAQDLTAGRGLDGWIIVEQLLADLGHLDHPVWLVIDDVHALDATDSLRQLELLLTRAPRNLRVALATRRDLKMGLHRLRLAGELTEIRAR